MDVLPATFVSACSRAIIGSAVLPAITGLLNSVCYAVRVHKKDGSWLNGTPRKFMSQILLGAAALCWAMWLNRNDMIFNNAKPNTFMQLIFRATFWIRAWSQLDKSEQAKETFKKGCRLLKTLIMEVFTKFGWRFSNRIST
jgi:hypothetical protein